MKKLALFFWLLAGPALAAQVQPVFQRDTVAGTIQVFNQTGLPVTMMTIDPVTAASSIPFNGATSGVTILQPSATASGTLTLPAATDTLIGKATTDTLTNKTYDTAGSGNSFKINGTAITAVTGSVNAVLSTSPTITGLTLAAGSLTVAPLNITSGTNLTTPTAGAVEYDGTSFYASPVASNRAVIDTTHFISITSGYTLSDVNTAQKAFNATTNGQITLPGSTAYLFDLSYLITNTGTTSHTWSVLFAGTASLTSGAMQCTAITAASSAVTASLTGYTTTLGSAFVVTAASTSSTENVTISCKGRVNINMTGTFIPQVKLSAATTGTETMLANSYFRMDPIGANTVTNVGNWN